MLMYHRTLSFIYIESKGKYLLHWVVLFQRTVFQSLKVHPEFTRFDFFQALSDKVISVLTATPITIHIMQLYLTSEGKRSVKLRLCYTPTLLHQKLELIFLCEDFGIYSGQLKLFCKVLKLYVAM